MDSRIEQAQKLLAAGRLEEARVIMNQFHSKRATKATQGCCRGRLK